MANHKSAIKRIRSTETKRSLNRYQAKTVRNAIRDLRENKDKASASGMLPKITSMLDKLVKKNIIHKNKAANLKSELTKKVSAL